MSNERGAHYYSPEKFGLTTVAEYDYDDMSFEFNLVVVWRRVDGTLVYGEDAGCSCPCPFEDQTTADLTELTPTGWPALKSKVLDSTGSTADRHAFIAAVEKALTAPQGSEEAGS